MEQDNLKKEEPTIKCSNCGLNIRSDSRNCIFCGRPIDLFEPKKQKTITINE